MDAAYVQLDDDRFRATALTRGPWNPDHQHVGPPSALIHSPFQSASQCAYLYDWASAVLEREVKLDYLQNAH